MASIGSVKGGKIDHRSSQKIAGMNVNVQNVN
jgi:hypothetical protein